MAEILLFSRSVGGVKKQVEKDASKMKWKRTWCIQLLESGTQIEISFSRYAKLKFNSCFFEKTLRKETQAKPVPMNKCITCMGYCTDISLKMMLASGKLDGLVFEKMCQKLLRRANFR